MWSKAKQQLLIDSIINGFDIPKIYFHEHSTRLEIDGRRVKYSLVDGRQRLEAIWDFLDNHFGLADDFVFLEDGSTDAAGLTFDQLVRDVPDMAAVFSATSLDVMLIRTDDIELIEEMFSRLNEAVPLNAAEKRNGRGGPLRPLVRQLVQEPFFRDRLPFENSRYRHFDLATKFLRWSAFSGPADVKKKQLDDFWEEIKAAPDGDVRASRAITETTPVVDSMSDVFIDNDPLLASVGMVSVYFLLFQRLAKKGRSAPSRTELEAFNRDRRIKRFNDESDLKDEQRRLLEFDRLAQSVNDEAALRFRVNVLEDYLQDPSAFT
ncbi:hypothetical protein Z045_26005 [Rhodococcus pyridinivorans KG-16]|uniref:GmrSD restriction endonucleases N-terminal domain-containing protein n=1 Tax=Rhodococcus pyridinivorans KG-16 TaxID=1441730 RepID=A0A0V9UDF4_9NOCA|nr:hypothetical protein Z045_26005 [Rhodococcus pyridinivorans KG-16]